ncbi:MULTISPECIES: hypothetical protein [Brevibacillus]|nr:MULTISPECIES: hypothetical protein [Brevibacillus]MBY0088678.1 hypothetical protein [Brevibacillus brevis]MCE0448793.1 hypothetical protein [Brevibacillus sp. AF8]MCM3141352.1 hypothetical protein [Brevibacillus sp. MER 51]
MKQDAPEYQTAENKIIPHVFSPDSELQNPSTEVEMNRMMAVVVNILR